MLNKLTMNKRTFCINCYSDEVYFIKVKGRVMMRCNKCNSYIKWAAPEEYAGKLIVNSISKRLF
jgi:uncharacterized Zn finger protein